MQLLEHIHGGNTVRASRKYGLPAREFIDFSANINPLGPSRQAVKAIIESLELISSYPDPDCSDLRSDLAKYLDVDEECLLMGNGAAELIYLLVRVVNIRKALIPVPTFSEYGLAVKCQGGHVQEIHMEENSFFKLPLEKVLSSLEGTDILFLCNPNNPTGNLIDIHTMEKILDKAAGSGVMVVVDEAFMDFVPGRERYSVMSMAGKKENLAVLYSLTKFFGIPGLRLGAIAASRDLIARMNASKDPWNVNILAQAAGLAGLKDWEYIQATNTLVRDEREFLMRYLAEIQGLKPLPGAANFILVRVAGSGLTSDELTDRMGREGILVRDCKGFGGLDGRYIRIAVKSRRENEKLIGALKLIIGGK